MVFGSALVFVNGGLAWGELGFEQRTVTNDGYALVLSANRIR